MQLTLQAARARKRWTLEQLAAASGINKSTISRLERSETEPMRATSDALEAALGLKRGALVFGSREAVA